MLTLRNESTQRAGMGDIDLEHAQVGDAFYQVGFRPPVTAMSMRDNGRAEDGASSSVPNRVRKYTVVRVMARKVVAEYSANQSTYQEVFSRKVFVANAAVDPNAVMWARMIVRRSVKFGLMLDRLQAVLRSPEVLMLDDELLAGLDAWAGRHGVAWRPQDAESPSSKESA